MKGLPVLIIILLITYISVHLLFEHRGNNVLYLVLLHRAKEATHREEERGGKPRRTTQNKENIII